MQGFLRWRIWKAEQMHCAHLWKTTCDCWIWGIWKHCVQEIVAGPADVIGDASQTALGGVVSNIFQRGSASSKKHSMEAFALGDRAGILHHLDQAAIIPHIAETENKKFPYEVGLPRWNFICAGFAPGPGTSYIASLSCWCWKNWHFGRPTHEGQLRNTLHTNPNSRHERT